MSARQRSPRRALPALLIGLATAAACLPAEPPAQPSFPKPRPSTASDATGISSDPSAVTRIQADVVYLASPELAGRGTGTQGARVAADWVARRFREIGLEPLGDAGTAGASRGWLQQFQARIGAKVDPATVTWEAGGRKSQLAPEEVTTAEGSASGDAVAEVVFVGHGITAAAVGWDDYAGADVAGKVVVVLDGAPGVAKATPPPPGPAHATQPPPQGAHPHGEPDAPSPAPDAARSLRDFGAVRYKLRTAREHKAAGVVVVASGEDLPATPAEASSMGIPAVVMRRSAAQKLLSAGKIDVDKFRAAAQASRALVLPKTTASLRTRVHPLEADAWNVVGALRAREGSRHATEWVIVGAHYDHLGHGGTSASRAPGERAIHPGADDNASGTALLLEVARRLARQPMRPERNLLFVAFGAEEIGTIGSRYWVDHPPIPIASVVAMINADMVGRMRGRRLLVDGVGTSPDWPDVVRRASAGLGLQLTFGNEGFGASDHASFTAARVPVTFLFTGVHDDYHKPSDTPDKVDPAGIELASTLAARLAHLVSERPARLAFADAPSDPHRGMRGGFRVSLGTMPDYAFQGKGMRLSGVRPDAPAARAGLQAGDVLVKIGSHEITNVHDFMYALGELEPGREVAVEAERSGKRVHLKVIPAPGR